MFKNAVYKRYVDNIFVLFKSIDHLLLLARYMNTRRRNLKFTFGFKQKNRLTFLDNKITRGNKGFPQFIIKPRLVEFS